MSIIHGLSLASTDVVRAVKLVEEHPIYAFVSMHVVIIYSAFKSLPVLHEFILSLGWNPRRNIYSWFHWVGLGLLEWIGGQ